MPHRRCSLRKRKLQVIDVSSDDCDDYGESVQSRVENDFPTDDDAMQHHMQRKTRTSAQSQQQPKSERQQAALFRKLEATDTGQDRAGTSKCVRGGSRKRRDSIRNVNWRDRHGETVLHKLVTYGTVAEIERLIEQGASVNARDYADWTALHEACFKGLPDAVECLLKAGADVNVAADGGTTPLHDAAFSGSLRVVELLLQYGADASRTDNSCSTPLEVSTSDEVTKCLKEHMHRMTESSQALGQAQCPESNETVSGSHPDITEVFVVEVDTASAQSRLPSPPLQCPTIAPPSLENCALDHPASCPAPKLTTEQRTPEEGPFILFGPYVDPPRSIPDAASPAPLLEEPSPSSSLTLVVDCVFDDECPTVISPATASSSAVTLSSTSVAASPSTSGVAISVGEETEKRVTRSRSRSVVEATGSGVVVAGELPTIGGGDGDLVSGGTVSPPEKIPSPDCGRSTPSHPVVVYEDISDAEGDTEEISLLLCPSETSLARPKELGPRIICFATNSDTANSNSLNSVVFPPPSPLPDVLLTGGALKDSRSSALDLHSYSQTELSNPLPAGWFEGLKWKTSKCASSVGSGAEEQASVRPGFGEIPVRRKYQRKVPAIPKKCIIRSKASSASGKAPVLARKTPKGTSQCCNQDCMIVPDQRSGNKVQRLLLPAPRNPISSLQADLSGLRCDVCIQNPAVDAPREGSVVISCPDSTSTSEVNNNVGYCVVPSKSSNSFQRVVSLVDRLNKTQPQTLKSEESQSVALNKLGRDVIVFLRKATFDVHSGMKPFGVPSATGTPGEESQPGKTADDSLPVESVISGQRFFIADPGSQSGTGVPKTERTKKRIVLCKSLLRKGPVPLPGSILHNANQKTCAFDWNRPLAKSTILVDKSTMTSESDWELTESVSKDQSSVSGNLTCQAPAEKSMNSTTDVSPVAVQNITAEACTVRTYSGDWKNAAHTPHLFGQLSGFPEAFKSISRSNGCSQSTNAISFRSYLQTQKSVAPISDGAEKPCRTEMQKKTPSLQLAKTSRQSKHALDLDCDTVIKKHVHSRAGNGISIPTGTYPVVCSLGGETPLKGKVACRCEQKVMDICSSANFHSGFEQVVGDVSAEPRGKTFGKKLKSSTETSSSCRKELGVAKNVGARKKNASNDRVGQLDTEDAPSEQNSVGSETDCGRLKRAAGFGSGSGSGCGQGKGKHARIVRQKGDHHPAQTLKASVTTEDCSGDQLRVGEEVCHSKKISDYLLWHGLCSKPSNPVDSLINVARKISPADRPKPDFPKEFEKFLMATREYNISSNSSIQEIAIPVGLDLPLRKLFIKQEKERRKLKQEQNMRWERLVLTMEAEVMREYVEEEKRQDAFRPFSSCNVLCLQNFCSRSHDNRSESRPQNNDRKSRLKGLKEKFIEFETDLHFQLQNETSVLHSCQVQEWERVVAGCQPANSMRIPPQLCIPKVASLPCLVSEFFDKLNLYQ